MAIRTISGFHPWGSTYYNITNGDDVDAVDFHFQSNQIPQSYQESGLNLPSNGSGGALIVRNNPNALVRGGAGTKASYIETYIPDGMEWSTYYSSGLGLNQCAFQVRGNDASSGCPFSVLSDWVVDGGWDGCKTPYSPGTRYERCAFFRLRDDIVEFDQGLRSFGDSYEWWDNLAVGYGNGLSTRPGAQTPDPPGGHIIDVQRSVFICNQTLRNLSEADPYVPGILRKTNNTGTVSYHFTDCVIAYDQDIYFQSAPTSYLAYNGNGDTVTNCTFVWLGSGSPPAKFGLDQPGQDWTVISGNGAQNHLGVTGTSARDWLQNYLVAWLETAGREKLLATIREKVDWTKILSGNPPSRVQMLPDMAAKLAGSPTSSYNGPIFYVNSGAAGNGDGSLSTPWNSLAQVASYASSPGFTSGSSILLERGSVFREGLVLPASGTSANPIRLGDRGTGDRPKILGSPDLDQPGGWSHVAGGRWSHPCPSLVAGGPASLWLANEHQGPPAASTAAVEAGPAGSWFWASGTLHLQSGGAGTNPTTLWSSIRANAGVLGLGVVGSWVNVDHLDVENFHTGVRLGSDGVGTPAGQGVTISDSSSLRHTNQCVVVESTNGRATSVQGSFNFQAGGSAIGLEINAAGVQVIGGEYKKNGTDGVRITAGAGFLLDGVMVGGVGNDSPREAGVRRLANVAGTIRNCVVRSGSTDPTQATLWVNGSATLTTQDNQWIHDGDWACNRPEAGAVHNSTRDFWWATGGSAYAVWGGEPGQGAVTTLVECELASDAQAVPWGAAAGITNSSNTLSLDRCTLVARGPTNYAARRRSGGNLIMIDCILRSTGGAPLSLEDSFGDPYTAPSINSCLLWRGDGGTLLIKGEHQGAAPDSTGVPDRSVAEVQAGTVGSTDGYLTSVVAADPLFSSLSALTLSVLPGSPAVGAGTGGINLGADQITTAAPAPGVSSMPMIAAANAIRFTTTADFGQGNIPNGAAVTGFYNLGGLGAGASGRPVHYSVRLRSDHTTHEMGLATYDEGLGVLVRDASSVQTAQLAGVEVSGALVDFPPGEKEVWVGGPLGSTLERVYRQLPVAQINLEDSDWTYSESLGGKLLIRASTTVPLTADRTLTFPADEGFQGDQVWVQNPGTQTFNLLLRLEDPNSPGSYTTATLGPGRSRVLWKEVDSPAWWTNWGPRDIHSAQHTLVGRVGAGFGEVTALSRSSFTDGSTLPTDGQVVGFLASGELRRFSVPTTSAESFPTVVVAGTTDTIGSAQNHTHRVYTSASPVAVTVNSTLPTDGGVSLRRDGAGEVTLTGSGVTLNGGASRKLVGTAVLRREGTDTDLLLEGNTDQPQSFAGNVAFLGGTTGITESLIIAVGDETTALTAGTGKVTFRMPYAFVLNAVRASVRTAPTGSALIIDINEGGVSVLSTKLSIDATEKTSTTAATAAVIGDTALADDAEITIDIDQIGSSTAGAGLKVTLIGQRS